MEDSGYTLITPEDQRRSQAILTTTQMTDEQKPLLATKAAHNPNKEKAPEILKFIFKASLGNSVVLGALGAVALYIGEKEGNNFLVKVGTASLASGVVIGLVASAALGIRAVTPDSKLEESKATEIKTSAAAIKA